jgi:3-isopropylmalate/(R)-2-methylmalate dehydratase small subunit
MNKFTIISSPALIINTENVDTDQIIPAKFLKTTTSIGLGKYLFYNWRFDDNGKPKNNEFNNLNYQTVKILMAGNNFGCGSSREHAVWALMDFGFRVIISSSFGDIFYNNSLIKGLLPVILNPAELIRIMKIIIDSPKTLTTVNLEKQLLIIPDKKISYHFPIDPFRKKLLLTGLDELGFIMSYDRQIKKYETKNT